MAFSLIEWVDGSAACDEASNLGYWGLIIWTFVIVYLFVGLYVLCEIYFVPILIAISKRLNMSEDVAGATLMAAGSSAPELFTAIIGILFYTDENPGPSTNCASAAFNMCVIIGCSIFFCGYQSLPIRGYPFIRDCFFYAIAVVELYLFWEVITPGIIEWGESFTLVLSWCGYIVVLVYNNRVIKMMVHLMSWMGLTNAEEMLYEQLKPLNANMDKLQSKEAASLLHHHQHDTSLSDSNRSADCDTDDAPYNPIIDHPHTQTHDADTSVPPKPFENLPAVGILPNPRGQGNPRFLPMEMSEMDADEDAISSVGGGAAIHHKSSAHNAPAFRVLKKAPANAADSNSSAAQNISVSMAPMKIPEHTATPTTEHDSHSEHQPSCNTVWGCTLWPFHMAFKYTLPRTNQESSTPRLMLAFTLVLVWLGVLTFICVDAAEKMGNCLHISEDVMGLTLLAIGSSLPDCFSSVLAAKQGKGEMAVSNALGSNVFDINICIGVSFLLKSMVGGFVRIEVEHDEGFELFIAALFVLLAVFMVAMFCYGLVLNKKIGAGLMGVYAVFLGAFCYLLQFD